MSALDILNLVPGADYPLSVTISTSAGVTATSAVLKIDTEAGVNVLSKTITTEAGDDGVITDASPGGTATLSFLLLAVDTALLLSTVPYYLYSIKVTDSASKITYSVPLGRIHSQSVG